MFLFIVGLTAINTTNNSYAFSIISPEKNISFYKDLKYLKASDFIQLSVKEFSDLTGRRINLWTKLSFKIMKLRMKHDLKKNPDLLITDYAPKKKNKGLKILLWVLVGFTVLLLILTVLVGAALRHP